MTLEFCLNGPPNLTPICSMTILLPNWLGFYEDNLRKEMAKNASEQNGSLMHLHYIKPRVENTSMFNQVLRLVR